MEAQVNSRNVLIGLNYFLLTAMMVMLGASLASFWQVIVWRTRAKKPWWRGMSFCDRCRHSLSWLDKIPLLSFVWLKGQCRYCQHRINAAYWWWEVLLGAAFGGWFYWCGEKFFASFVGGEGQSLWWWWQAVVLLAMIVVLLWTSLQDCYTQQIANGWLWVLAGLVGLLLVGRGGELGWQSLSQGIIWSGLMAVGIGGGFYSLNFLARWVWHRPGLGSGDAWVWSLLAFTMTPVQFGSSVLLAFWSGALVGIAYLVYQRYHSPKKTNHTLPFLPFVTTGWLLSLGWGEWLWYLLFPF